MGREVASDWKGILSVVIYSGSIILAFLQPWLSTLFYALVAAMWFIPDRRYERASSATEEPKRGSVSSR
jgi:uncharacterized membrane protein